VVVALEGAQPGVDPDDLALAATDHRSRAGEGYLVSAQADGVVLLLAAEPPVDLAELTKVLGQRIGAELRAGRGAPATASDVARSLCRLEGWPAAGFEDLGTYRLLLSMADPDALRAFADAMLAPLDGYDHDHDGDLIASLQAFLQHNARWEAAAAQLYVHRHTLRYRMRKVEELTGRDLSSSFDRMEFWLALRARDLLAAQQSD
jgi:purine catabolism regulator